MNADGGNERGLFLGIVIIVALAVMGILPFLYGFKTGPGERGPAAVLTGIYLQFWGVLFLLSYFFPQKSFFFRGLLWVCEHFSSPRGRRMAFFYFLMFFAMGSLAVLQGLGLLTL